MKKLLLALALVVTLGINAHTQQTPDFQYGAGGGEGVDVCAGQTQDVGDVFTSSGSTGSCYNLQQPPGAGGGEANTASDLGGGVGITNTKVGVDLPFDTFSTNQFQATANVISLNPIANFVGTGDWDLGGGSLEIPNGTTLPGTCTVGQQFMDTDATSGQMHFLCESANTWVLQGDGGGGGGGYTTVQEEGISLTQRAIINFIGTSVTCVDNAGQTRTDCTIAGGGSQTPWTSNIDGAGFDLTGVGDLEASEIFFGGQSWSYDGTRANWKQGGVNTFFSIGTNATQNGAIVQQDMGWCMSTSDTNSISKEACLYYDGADTFNLGSASGTADANLEVNRILVENTNTISAPNISFFDDPNTGINNPSADEMSIVLGGANKLGFSTIGAEGSLNFEHGGLIVWSSGDDISTGYDTGICRNAAGVLMVNDGAGCVFGTDTADVLADEVQLADQGTKGTCDSAKAGTIAYEVVTNVGTFYGCRQTAASTYAWTALH